MQLFIFSCHAKQLASESIGEVIDFSPQLSSLSFISRSYQLWTILNHGFIPSERFCIQIHSISHRIVRFIVSKHNFIFKRHWHSQRNLNKGFRNWGEDGKGIIDAAGVRMWGTIDFKEESRDLTVFMYLELVLIGPKPSRNCFSTPWLPLTKSPGQMSFRARVFLAWSELRVLFFSLSSAEQRHEYANLMFMKIQYKVMKFA